MSCRERKKVDRHFAGGLDPGDEHQLREHLPGCEECRRYYERHQLLARLDPQALSVEERLARGLGIAPAPRRAWVWASVSVAAAMALLLLVRAPGGFVSRGGKPDDHAEISVYRVSGNQTPQRAEGRMRAGDALAFAYRNPEGWTHLLVFAVDETGRVYWYYPQWDDATADPHAIDIRSASAPVELGEAVSHDLAGKQLVVHGLFTNEAPGVHEIEERLAKKSSLGGRDAVTRLEVEH